METPSTSTFSLSSLLCQESASIFLSDQENPFLINPDSDDEYVKLMWQREKSDSSFPPSSSSSSFALTKIARLNAIDYILHIKDRFGFESHTAYLAVTYLDRFISLRTLDNEKRWATELLSIGCLSLAAKLQESTFQLGDFRFEAKAIQRMELLILTTLEWKMDSVTPFAFLPYFIDKLFIGSPPRSIFTRILELILTIMKDISLMDHYPSAIASAAVFMSIDGSLTRNSLHSKIKALPCRRFLDIDDVTTCYLIMQK